MAAWCLVSRALGLRAGLEWPGLGQAFPASDEAEQKQKLESTPSGGPAQNRFNLNQPGAAWGWGGCHHRAWGGQALGVVLGLAATLCPGLLPTACHLCSILLILSSPDPHALKFPNQLNPRTSLTLSVSSAPFQVSSREIERAWGRSTSLPCHHQLLKFYIPLTGTLCLLQMCPVSRLSLAQLWSLDTKSLTIHEGS